MLTRGQRLRAERERLGYSQTAFGQLGGVRVQAQSLYEADKRAPDATYLELLSLAGVDISFVLTGVRSVIRPGMPADDIDFFNGLIDIAWALSEEGRAALLGKAAFLLQHELRTSGQTRGVRRRAALETAHSTTQTFHAQVGQVAGRDIHNTGKGAGDEGDAEIPKRR